MKKVLFSSLMLSALFVIASCGSKSNSGEATEAAAEETATPQCEPADPPFTYSKYEESDGFETYVDVPLKGCLEMQKVAVAKSTNENRKSEYSYKVNATINVKLIKEFPEKVDKILGTIQFIDKDGSVLQKVYTDLDELIGLEVGDVAVITDYKLAEYDADELVANTKYIRIAELKAGHKTESLYDEMNDAVSDEIRNRLNK